MAPDLLIDPKLNEEAKMRNGMTRLGLCLTAVLLLGAPVAAQEAFDWQGQLETGQFVRIQGISGDIRATAVDGAVARVEAHKRGRSSSFDDVRIVVDEGRDGVTVCAVYGQPDRTDCDGRNGRRDYDHSDREGRDHNIQVSVDFEVQVPAGVRLRTELVSGDVRADGLRSDVVASTVSGDVRLSTSGIAEASTVSGDIDVEMATATDHDLDFETVSGDITVYLPEDLGADVRFSSLTGDFETDLAVSVTRRRDGLVGSSVRGQLGGGGARLSFSTVSGNVELRRLRE
ncbi:MAG: DUF4097 family beta strand repeat-containing protein [Longimicrobiales bacterium]